MSVFVVVELASGRIANRIEIDNVGDWEPPEGSYLVEDVEHIFAIGGYFVDGSYLPPPANDPGPGVPPADPGDMPPRLVASALSVEVADGDIAKVEGIYGLAGAIYLDVGQFMLLFIAEQPDTDFYALINGGAPCMSVSDKGVDYVVIAASDSVGGPGVDPAQFSVQIFRV